MKFDKFILPVFLLVVSTFDAVVDSVSKSLENLCLKSPGSSGEIMYTNSALEVGDGCTANTKDSVSKPLENVCLKSLGNSEEIIYEDGSTKNIEGSSDVLGEDDLRLIQRRKGKQKLTTSPKGKQKLTTSPKSFVANEVLGGTTINVVSGLKLYDKLFERSEVLNLVSMVNDLRAAGKNKQLQGRTFMAPTRPMYGHGSEILQFGVSIAEVPTEYENSEPIVEYIPYLLQKALERLVSMDIMTMKPDSCIVDIYQEREYSLPHIWPNSFGTPICVLFLTECDMMFGRVIFPDYGSLKLSLSPGSLLAMHGNSRDFANHSIPSINRQRMLVTFVKCQPRETSPSVDRPESSSHATPPRLNTPPRHHAPVPQFPAQIVHQPLFVAADAAPNSLLPPGATWVAAAPPPCFPVSGTGVFVPQPGSGTTTDANYSEEPERNMLEMEDSSGKS